MSALKPTISLCVIAKNEEDCIARCITSVKNIVSEIIVVDTGSTDRTKEIAFNLGAKVFEYPWNNDYSAPRNLSLSKAQADWILVLDADEAIAQIDHIKILNLIQNNGICYEMSQRHYTDNPLLSNFTPIHGEYPEWEQGQAGYFESNCVRLFPNHQGVHFRGKVHELVEHSIYERKQLKIVRSDIRIQHYGHTQAAKAKKSKSLTYKTLGEIKIIENPLDWKNYFELAIQLTNDGRIAESIAPIKAAIALNPKYVESWLNLGYCLCELGSFDQAIIALQNALQLCPGNAQAQCNLGVCYLRKTQLTQAAMYFQGAIESDPRYVNAYCNLARTFWYDKQPENAIQAFSRALELMPSLASARVDLAAILLACGKFDQAKVHLETALNQDKNISRAYYYQGKALAALNETKAAIDSLERFCQLEGNKEGDSASLLQDAHEQALRLKESVANSLP